MDIIQLLQSSKAIFEPLSYITVVLGIPTAIFEYSEAKRKEKLDRDYGTYNALDEKYLEFQKLNFENPSLDTFDIPDKKPTDQLSDLHKKQELIAFTMLISIFERAFLMYRDASKDVRNKQWTPGWEAYMHEYCKRDNFKASWRIVGNAFDIDFVEYIDKIIKAQSPVKA